MANPPREQVARRFPRGRIPPYVSYGQFKSLLRRLQRDGIPMQVDSSIINHLSASAQIQTLLAFRFLGLIDLDGRPASTLSSLVSAVDCDAWATELRSVLHHAYAPVLELALESATPEQLTKEFEQHFPGTNNVLRKSRTFFLHGAREAGIDLSPYLRATIKPRADAPNRGLHSRSRNSQTGSPPSRAGRMTSGPPSAAVAAVASHQAPLLSERLVSELDIRQMTEMQQRAFWTMLKFLKELGR
jgi:Family of unknown function (DUF5343)